MGALGDRFHEVAGIIPVIRVGSMARSHRRLRNGKVIDDLGCAAAWHLSLYRATATDFLCIAEEVSKAFHQHRKIVQ